MLSSKTKPNSIETERGKEFNNNIFQTFLNKYSIKIYSRNTSLGAVIAERFNKSIRNLIKRPVFEKGESNSTDVLPKITKQ